MAQVNNYIYEKYNERGMRTFEKKVGKLLKNNGIKGNVICHNAYVKVQGRGSYLKVAEIEVNGDIVTLTEHTHDSIFWDNWEHPDSRDKRDLFLAVLENTIEELKDNIWHK